MRLLVVAVLLLALSGFAVPQKELQDFPAEMQKMERTQQALETAKRELASSPDDWDTHRNKAIGHVTDALEDIRQAEAWARDRQKMKK